MNTAGYPTTLRPVLTADGLVRRFALAACRGRVSGARLEAIASAAAAVFDIFDEQELIGLVVDCGAIAADLDQPLGVKRLAATVALAAESAHDEGACTWDRALDWLVAGEYLHYETQAKTKGREWQ